MSSNDRLGAGLAGEPWAMPAFFLGWMGIGVFVGLVLSRRGHHRRTMAVLGLGLGPLMLLVASDALRRRDREAGPLVLSPGVDQGGDLDIMVHIQDTGEDIRSVASTLSALASEIGNLTLAQTVDYEWLEGDTDNDVVNAASAVLLMARDLMPIKNPGLVVFPGTVATTVRGFEARSRKTLVLFALDESITAPGR